MELRQAEGGNGQVTRWALARVSRIPAFSLRYALITNISWAWWPGFNPSHPEAARQVFESEASQSYPVRPCCQSKDKSQQPKQTEYH